jgi:hypothetical protein
MAPLKDTSHPPEQVPQGVADAQAANGPFAE